MYTKNEKIMFQGIILCIFFTFALSDIRIDNN